MLPEWFIFVSLAMHFLGGASYIFNTLRGKTQPNRISWGLFGFIAIITFFIQYDQAKDTAVYFTLIAGINPTLIFLASFVNKKSYWKLGRQDYLAGLASLAAIAIWLMADNIFVALVFSILADFIALSPTLIKAYLAPYSESVILYIVAIFTSTISLLTLKELSFINSAFAVYIALVCLFTSSVILLRRRNITKPA